MPSTNALVRVLSGHNAKLLALGVSLFGLSVIFVKEYKAYKRQQKRKNFPKNVVILHQFPRGIRAPSVSPFCLKFETWLRMNNIPYVNDLCIEMSSKGKMPWISYISDTEDVDIADSEFCQKYLMQKFNKDLNQSLLQQQSSVAHAFLKMTEESLLWVFLLHRYVYRISEQESGVTDLVVKIYSLKVKNGSYYQGYARHSREDVYAIGKKDLKALDEFIGSNKYLLGDQLCNEDAGVFGMLVQIIYHSRGVLYDFIQSDCHNLIRYVETIKSEFWKDWDQNVSGKPL